jgi:thioester reductase-like protein
MSRGRNIYPQDMEQTAERAHPFVRAGGVAAFRIEGPEEAAGIIAEIDRKALKTAPSPAQLERAVWDVRRSVAVTHGVPIEAVALVKPDTLPRTTSGKRQRLRIAQMWKQGEIQPLASIIRTSQEAPRDASLQGWLRGRVAALLGVEVSAIDTSCTLPELGLDSLRTLELLVSLEARFSGVPFAGLLTQSIDDLTSRMVEGKGSKAPWFEDAELPQDIRCANEAEAPASGRVLVTGATGFLGASIAIQVLETTDATLLCLVRGEGGEARLLTSLSNHPDWRPRWQGRVQAIEGDLTSPLLGLDEELYDGLAKGLDGIYHTAAMVNWVYPYRALSPTNVEGTRTLLRLACLNSTPFAYISTMAVCWSLGAVGVVDEDTDPMAHIDGIHLDYVRTKAVAEGLVRQAGSRGLPATIFRPGLIFSHSRTGQHSAGDFLSALFKGCIEMRAAPDLDWSLDVCPVDEVARIVVDRMKRSPGGGGTLHLEAPDRRLWRGAVLWMNLRGYDVKLLDYERWCERLETQVSDPTAALRPLYSFFTRPVEGLDGLRLPQLYEEGRRNPMSSEGSGVALEGQPRCRLDARQLEKTFDSLVDCGYLPAPQNPATPQKSSPPWSPAILEDLLQAHFADPRLRLLNATPRDWGDNPDVGNPAEHGIIGELASWRYGRSAGLYRFELSYQRGTRVETLPAVLKAQVPDRDTIDVGTEVAALCGAELGAAWETHREANEMLSSHLREPAIYALEDPELVAHRPVVYGARPGFLLLEDLTGMPLLDSADQPGRWQRPQIEAAIEGIAKVHSLWFGRPCAAPWLAPPRCSAALVAQASLWKALAGFACARPFGRWLGARGLGRYERLRLEIGAWSKLADSLPQTLIHNDFNPRNVALRDGVRLCAYDWELARVGLPQRDLAEFLCFTLTPDVTEEALTGWLELHRRALESAAGRPIDASRWRQGFGAALADFLVTRLPLYVMIDAFRPQHFLGRVVETWTRLDALAGFPTGGTK